MEMSQTCNINILNRMHNEQLEINPQYQDGCNAPCDHTRTYNNNRLGQIRGNSDAIN